MAAAGGTARLADRGPPAAEKILAQLWLSLPPCDATASGSEAAQVQLVRGPAGLALCSHHYALYEIALAASGWKITHDNRGELS